ncbi:MAG: aminotransferase class V-fold PLP-dependent enzyme [Cyclobacteriaceae bacterium]|nr:aminotransferase class V-fold PLP-dependent enzyme [Cyclobacteriaceae bacterium]
MKGADAFVLPEVDVPLDFQDIARNVVGHHHELETVAGKKRLLYADWIASGRLYAPIEQLMLEQFGPLVGNTHSESSYVGETMTHAYLTARKIIKKHVNANHEDILISCGSGMTGAIAKLQRILGLHIPDRAKTYYNIPADQRPVVFITHMEHHSNQTSWLECEVDVVVIPPDENLLISVDNLERELLKYRHRKVKIGSFTACSNVTGIFAPYHKMAAVMHKHGGVCFIDFAASAPYADMNMHPEKKEEELDAITFSPHKFLGGPGSPGILIFNQKLYTNTVPDEPGGGTVLWTNPWGEHHYFEDIETREDGGTPAFLQTIKAALAIRLKEKMTTGAIAKREEELFNLAYAKLSTVNGLTILAPDPAKRLAVVSFYVEHLHYNFVVRVLSDHFGIQVRGGCSCAGTYGHYLLHVSKEQSHEITGKIDSGDLSAKPGWVRLSLHPVMTNEEVDYICAAIKQVAENPEQWMKGYTYSVKANEYYPVGAKSSIIEQVDSWFDLPE